MDFPRILIINGEPFQDKTATGITLKNIFKIIPSENISFIHLSNIYPDLEYLDNVYSYFQDDIQKQRKGDRFVVVEKKSHPRSQINNALRKEVNQWLDLIPIKISQKLNQYIIDSEATIIYSCLGNFKVNRLVLHAQKILKCKIVTHFMDDWKSQIYSDMRFIYHRVLLKKHLNEIFEKSQEGIAISESLASKYESQYNLPFYFIMNSIPDNLIKEYNWENKQPVNYVFTGGLHLNRWKSLITICQSLNLLNIPEIKLSIYCPANDRYKFSHYFTKFPFVSFYEYVPFKDLEIIFRESDILIHCESFDKNIAQYTKYSISTKIPEYMKEAKLILAYGPSHIESLEYLKRNNAGITLTEKNSILLASQIKNQIYDDIRHKEKIKNATILVKQNHSFSSIAEKIRKIFI